MRQMPFRLTPAAVERGAAALEWRRIDADNQKLHAFLRTRVYEVRPLPELAKQGAMWAGVFLVFGLVGGRAAGPQGATDVPGRPDRARPGDGGTRRVQPQTATTRAHAGHRLRHHGAAIVARTAAYKWAYGPMVRIPAEDEPRHMLLEGTRGGARARPSASLPCRLPTATKRPSFTILRWST